MKRFLSSALPPAALAGALDVVFWARRSAGFWPRGADLIPPRTAI